MAAKTTTRVLDKKGVKLVVGQNVTVEQSGQCGQLLGVNEQGMCLVRISATGEVLSVLASALNVASWDQVRNQNKANNGDKTRLF
ncbi:MAG: hypothetical protein KBG84_03445 [Planctomycetes bacterium]|nr:hypothetical protein [Planctomycetota bacterium]CAG0961554.1 hypothetical protein PLCT2_00789 [Planctomycetaceae bacterium]